jgi:hypothetical protein
MHTIGSAVTLHACSVVLAAAVLLGVQPAAHAIVGDARQAAGRAAQSLVVVSLPNGRCTGIVLARDLVLTAGHCVAHEKIRVRPYGDRKLHRVIHAVLHPLYDDDPSAIPTRVDLALLKLATSLPDRAKPALLARRHTTAGEAVLVVGYGLHDADAVTVTGRARMATLIALDQRLGIQLQLRDPTMLQGAQLGACGGDSGGPAFAMREDLIVVGVVSAGPERCGGLTLVTPTAAYYDWIVETARKLGSPIGH